MRSANTIATLTVVGGGIAGLVAATEAAEAGCAVRLLEARSRMGGRAASNPSPWVTNLGPHALYSGTALWTWLRARHLHKPATMPKNARLSFVWEDRASRIPPLALVRAMARLGADQAPVDVAFRTWATERWGADTAQALSGLAGALTFDHDPGRISAAFVAPRMRDILVRQPPVARYVAGGWGALVERMVTYARAAGVDVEVGAKVDAGCLDDLKRQGPVIVAVSPDAARRLLGVESSPEALRRVALLDVGLERSRRDPYLILDLDHAVFGTRPSAVLSGIAPAGHDLLQLSVGMSDADDLDSAEAKLERALDRAVEGWRERTVWRRRAAVRGAAGAVDLPGSTWRDRPPINRGGGLWMVGDWVAAPGHLAEVSVTSAQRAVREAVADASTLRGGEAARSRRAS